MRKLFLVLLAAICLSGVADAPPVAAVTYEHNHSAFWNQVPDRKWDCINHIPADATACFASHGEYFRLRDESYDGHSVVIDWKTASEDRKGSIWDLKGWRPSAWTYENKSFAEGRVIYWRICKGEHADRFMFMCSDWMLSFA